MRSVKLVGLLICVAFLGIAQASRGQDLSANKDLGTGLINAQKKAAAAADASASLLDPSKQSAAYVAVFRAELNRQLPPAIKDTPSAIVGLDTHIANFNSNTAIYGGTPVLGPTTTLTTPVAPFPTRSFLPDADPRYRTAVAALATSNYRIYGGIPSYGYANTVVLTGGTNLCTGVVIAPNVIITAQHCYCAGMTQAQVGNIYNPSAPQIAIAHGVPMKPCGTSTPVSEAADVALLFTATDFDPTSVPPARLATDAIIAQAQSVRAVGFGLTQTGILGTKMMVDIPLISPSCSGSVVASATSYTDNRYYGCNSGFELVAGDPMLLKDTCNGDSGGPVFIHDQSGNDYLAGTTSRSVISADGSDCGNGGIYVRLTGPVLDWIEAQKVAVIIG